MIYLIADFRADGKDNHQSFVAEGTTDRERAVDSVAEILRSQGAIVTQITVCPDAESMTAALDGERPAGVFISYPFNA